MTDPVINTPISAATIVSTPAAAPTVAGVVKADVKAERAGIRRFISLHPFEVVAYAVVGALIGAAFVALAVFAK